MKVLLIILALFTVAGIASSMELFYEVHTDSTEIGHRHTEFKIHNVILLAIVVFIVVRITKKFANLKSKST